MARAKNYTLGRGKLFVDLGDGEFYIGNTTSMTISGDEEVLQHFDSDEGIREQDDEAPLSDTVSIGFTTDDIQPENLAMFIKGEVTTLATLAAADQTETITVKRGRHYQLGTSDAHPSGLRAISGLTAKIGAVAVNAAGNFIVDEGLGRVYILEDAADIDDEDDVIFTYDVDASTRSIIISKNEKAYGALRYVSANPKGPDRDHFFPRVSITADGDYELKGDEWQNMSFSGAALKVPNRAKHYIDGRAVVA